MKTNYYPGQIVDKCGSSTNQKIDKGNPADYPGENTGKHSKREPENNGRKRACRHIEGIDSCKKNGMQDKNTHGQTAETDDQSFCLFCMNGKAQQKKKCNRVPQNRTGIIIEQVSKSVMDQIKTCFFDAEIIEDGQKKYQNTMKPQGHMHGKQHGVFLRFNSAQAAKEEKEQPCPEAERLGNILLDTITPVHG